MPPEQENHILDLLPAYVLSALTDEETLQVASHVETCPSCRAELAELQQVADDLPLAVRRSAPPPRVKASLMQAIHAQSAGVVLAARPAGKRHMLDSLRSSLPLVAIAVFAVLVVGNIFLWRQLQQVNNRLATTFQVVALANTSTSPAAHGELVMNGTGQYGTLVVDKLAALGSSRQYQVWLIKGEERTSGGVFSVNPDGYASLEILAPAPLVSYDSIGISIEPFGGSPSPTGAKVLGAPIPH